MNKRYFIISDFNDFAMMSHFLRGIGGVHNYVTSLIDEPNFLFVSVIDAGKFLRIVAQCKFKVTEIFL